uniref:Uncharacterized protein n=1 Tax=viral metagenome TaxID=1070528 RepID=A0A6C0IAQ2_9ZZZZ
MGFKSFLGSVDVKVNNFIRILVPLVVFVIVLLIITNYFKALISYTERFAWWGHFKGNSYSNGIDLKSYALFNYSKMSFDIQQKLTTGPKQTNETSIMLMQSIALNKFRQINQPASPAFFTTPYHICRSISWGPDEGPDFCNAIKSQYTNLSSWPTGMKTLPSGSTNDVSNWWNSHGSKCVSSNLSADNPQWSEQWSSAQPATTAAGFWPHQNGCSGFFDIPSGLYGSSSSATPYNLFDNIPEPRILTGKNTYNRPPLYVPGAQSCLGSWAQLFADWGIVYSINTSGGTSVVPVISDGAKCTDTMDPCPSTGMGWCTSSGSGKCDGSSLPSSDYQNWYASGSNGDTIGWNFLSVYRIHPASYIITSWVADLYDDPKTGIIFDAQAFRNLVGYQGTGSTFNAGGWNMFLKGLNTNLTSYDNVMNELFRQYATDFPVKTVTPGNNCSSSKLLKGAGMDGLAGAGTGAMIGTVAGPPGMLVGGIIGLCAGAFIGAKTAC